MPYLLDTNILSDLVKRPQGAVAAHIARVGEAEVCTSLIVAAELRYGAAKRASPRLSDQLEAILAVLPVLALETPVDNIYGDIRADLERRGALIGPNYLLIAAHALALQATLVTDNTREFIRVKGLKTENWLVA
ncbi:MAG: type II toxin-antitoxin system VapC family toxin [Pseudomonadota bacterium]